MHNKILSYNPKLKLLARQLRKNMTLSEILLWQYLKKKQMCGNEFIVDFYCKELMLAIEIDGISHDYQEAWRNDHLRQMKLEELGVKFLRFTDDEVKENLEGVLLEIHRWIHKPTPATAVPSKEGTLSYR